MALLPVRCVGVQLYVGVLPRHTSVCNRTKLLSYVMQGRSTTVIVQTSVQHTPMSSQPPTAPSTVASLMTVVALSVHTPAPLHSYVCCIAAMFEQQNNHNKKRGDCMRGYLYGPAGKSATHCAKHGQKHGYKDLRHKPCAHPDCNTRPIFGDWGFFVFLCVQLHLSPGTAVSSGKHRHLLWRCVR